MHKILIKCPTCLKNGNIEISEEKITNASRGLIAVNIAKDIICSHSYIVYIDKNLTVRDYFVTDFQIVLPKITPEDISKTEKIPSKEIIDIDLIKLNISAPLLTNILKAILLRQKIVLIFDQESLHNHIYNFFKYITQNSFKINITIMTEEKYDQNKNNYKDSMVFEHINIVRNIKNLLNPKKLEIERQIVHRFLTDPDLGYSYIILKNDIQKSYELSNAIVDFIKDDNNNNKNVNILKIKTLLENQYQVKIENLYLNFLIEIVNNYFNVNAPSYSDSFISSF